MAPCGASAWVQAPHGAYQHYRLCIGMISIKCWSWKSRWSVFLQPNWASCKNHIYSSEVGQSGVRSLHGKLQIHVIRSPTRMKNMKFQCPTKKITASGLIKKTWSNRKISKGQLSVTSPQSWAVTQEKVSLKKLELINTRSTERKESRTWQNPLSSLSAFNLENQSSSTADSFSGFFNCVVCLRCSLAAASL